MSRRKIVSTNLTFDEENFSDSTDSTNLSDNTDDEINMDPKNMFNVLNVETKPEEKLEQKEDENKEETKNDTKSTGRTTKDTNTLSKDDIEGRE